MKKIIALVVTLLLILTMFAGCGQDSKSSDASGSDAAASEPAQVQDDTASDTAETAAPSEANVSVTPPDGWEAIDGAALAQYRNGTASFIVTCDTVPADVSGPDAYVEFVKPQFKDVFPDASFSDTKSATVNGMDAKMLEFTASASGMTMKYQIYYILKDSNAYTITCSDLGDTFDSAGFQSLLDSFEIK